MMTFLHAHHAGEDAGLWPLVRERDPQSASLLDSMEADHRRVAPLVESCEDAARSYAAAPADDGRRTLLDAVLALEAALLPHLEREEREMMPVVSVAITPAEWRAIDDQYYLRSKSRTELAFEGHWLLDGLDAERTRVVVHQVPFVTRQVLVHGYRRRYQEHARACWGRGVYGSARTAPLDIPRSGGAEIVVPASVDAVWRVVADVTRVPEWSHECRRVVWTDGATHAVAGARFAGTNKAGPWRWTRVNEVLVADEPKVFSWRTVPTWRFPDSSEWRIELEPTDGGTRIRQTYEVLRAPALLARLYAIVVPTHRDRSSALVDDLRRIGEIAAERKRSATPVLH